MKRTLLLQRGVFAATRTALKKIGKSTETPDYKQAYLPYEVAPTAAELESARKRFSHAYYGQEEFRKLHEVKDVPANMYTYGKEGMSIPIAIFKDQQDPVIGPEWTYPSIYENKIACRYYTMHQLFEQEKKGTFDSPWLQDVLDERVEQNLQTVQRRMGMLNMKNMNVFHKERGASKKVGAAQPAATTSK